MTGNPVDSPWYATPRALRKRKPLTITLSDEAHERLDRMAKARAVPRSQVLEDLLMAASIRAEVATRRAARKPAKNTVSNARGKK